MSRLDDLYARYLTRLIADLVRFGQDAEDARDIAQETMIATWKRLDYVSPGGEWFYLKTAAHNLARKRAGRAGVPRRGAGFTIAPLENAGNACDQTPSTETALIVKEEIARFRAAFNTALAELGTETQKCVYLKKQGYSSRQTAELLGLTDQAVRSRLSRASSIIRARVGAPPPDVEWVELLGDDDDDYKT